MGVHRVEVVAAADVAVAGDEHVEVELSHPLEDRAPRADVAVADPRVRPDEDEVGREEHARVRDQEEGVTLGVTAAVGEELRSADRSPLVEELVGKARLDLRDRLHHLGRRVGGRLELLPQAGEPLLAGSRH